MSFHSRAWAFALRHTFGRARRGRDGALSFSLASAAWRMERTLEREAREADRAERRTREGLNND